MELNDESISKNEKIFCDTNKNKNQVKRKEESKKLNWWKKVCFKGKELEFNKN